MSIKASPPPEVIVLGAGVVGLTLALLLAERGHRVLILSRPSPAIDWRTSPAVSALNRASQRCFEQLGCWDGLGEAACIMRAMQVYTPTGDKLDWSSSTYGEPDLGHIVSNSILQTNLHNAAKAHALIRFEDGGPIEAITSSKDQITLTIAGVTWVAKWLIGADGAQSMLRQKMVGPIDMYHYGQVAHTAIMAHRRHHQGYATQHFLPDGPMALLPRYGGYHSVMVASWDGATPWSQDALLARLNDKMMAYYGPLTYASNMQTHPLMGHHTPRYAGHRWALVGDALLRVHPLAGQGLNAGLYQAAVLAQVLAAQFNGRSIASVERDYTLKTRASNLELLGLVTALRRWFADVPGAGQTLTGWFWHGLNQVHLAKGRMMRRAVYGHWIDD